MTDEYDLYDALRECVYRATEAGMPKGAILRDLRDITELVAEDDDEFPEEIIA